MNSIKNKNVSPTLTMRSELLNEYVVHFGALGLAKAMSVKAEKIKIYSTYVCEDDLNINCNVLIKILYAWPYYLFHSKTLLDWGDEETVTRFLKDYIVTKVKLCSDKDLQLFASQAPKFWSAVSLHYSNKWSEFITVICTELVEGDVGYTGRVSFFK